MNDTHTPTTFDMGDGIELLDGTAFNYATCNVDDIGIWQIAHVLSQVNRFAGHTIFPYSVAQHSLNASRIVPPEFAFEALMHDTAEMVTNDIVTPLKVRVPLFKQIEAKIEANMAAKFGFAFPLPPEVKQADLQMLGLEKDALKPTGSKWGILEGVEYEHLRPLVDLTERRAADVREEFLDRFDELSRLRKAA